MQDYQKRPGTTNLGDEYERLIPALFALRTLYRSDVVDMWLASNAEGMGAFDDVVFYVEFQDGQKKAYVMQLKHKGSSITAAAFTHSGSDDYTIIKYQKSFEEIILNKETKNMLENIDTEDIIFMMYTTADLAQTIDKDIMKKLNLVLYTHDVDQQEFSLLNTSKSNNCVYKFKIDDQNKGGYNENFLHQFYFYINQAPTVFVENLIQEIISEKFSNSDPNIKLNLLNFITMWVRGDLGGHYKLRKNEFQLKFTELLLDSYLVVPKRFLKFKNADLWNKLMNTAEIIIVNNYYKEELILSLIWSAIKSIVYNHTDRILREDISWESSIKLKFNGLPNKFTKQDLLKTLALKQVGTDRELTIKSLYIILWKAGLLPLLVKANNISEAKHIFSALLISSRQTIKRHVVLLFKGEDNAFENQTVLHTLADVKDLNLRQCILENLEISLQGRNPIPVSRIIIANDSDVLKDITIEMVLLMLYQPLIIGKKYEDLPENYIKRSVTKIVLNPNILKSSDDAFIINGPGNIISDIKTLTDPWRVIDGKNYFKEISARQNEQLGNLVVLEEEKELTFEAKQHLSKDKINFHYLRYYNGDLEWLRSVGNLEGIRKYLKHTQTFIPEEDILQHFSENIHIISSNPGMGKSVMIKCLAKTCMGDFWVQTIILNNHHKNLKQQENLFSFNFSDQDFTGYHQNFTGAIISILKKERKVYVLMDAFDEISSECVNPVISLAKNYQKLGYRLWITTRPSHSAYLEKKLNTFSISLNPFTKDDQKTYLTKLLHKKKKHNIHLFVDKLQKLMSKSFSNWDEEFLGVPLHLQMVAEVFEDKKIADLNELDKINSVDLYEAFINNKFDVYWKKMFGDNINGLNEKIYNRLLNQLKNQHAKASLLLFFPKTDLKEIIDLMEVEDFLKDPVTGDLGIIILGDDWEQPIFTHRTFAEFLAATFLATNCKRGQIRPLLVALFDEGLLVVRQLFDRILAKGCPLHLAVLNNNLNEVNKILQKRKGSSQKDYDLGGRTPLHLAAGYGSRHTFPENSNIVKDTSSNLDKLKNKLDHLPIQFVTITSSDHKVNLVEPHVLDILEKVLNIQEFNKYHENILGWNPIDYACHSYSLDVLEIIISDKPSKNIVDFFEKTSLTYYCVKFGYKNLLVQIDLENLYIREDLLGKNLFHIAVKHPDILEILFSKCSHSMTAVYLRMKDQQGDLPLTSSAMDGNLKVLQIVSKFKVDLNRTNGYGLTILHILVFYNHLECLEKFITEHPIDLNVRASGHSLRDYSFKNPGHTALYFAIVKTNMEIANLLIQNGADVHLKYENERTLLHVASINGFTGAIEKLFNSGAEIDSVDDKNRTPLHYAAQNIKLDSINLLLQLGADINKKDIFQLTPLHYAIQNFRLDRIEFPETLDINVKDTFNRSLLHYASQKIKIEDIIKFLLPLGNKHLGHWRQYGTAPAYRATNEEKLANINFLIKSGVNPNEGDYNGRTPLHYATEQNILENIESLIKFGANINQTDTFGQTPLFQATQNGNLDTIKFLLQLSADPNIYNQFKVTPLHVSAEKKFNNCARVFLENGANVNLSTDDGCTPLFIATRKNNLQLIRILLQNKANVNKPSRDTFINGKSNCVSGNFKPDSENSTANMLSPLQVAIQIGNMKIITLLLESKPKINQTDNNGWTALHFAAYHGRDECIDNLVIRGAELHKQSNDGSTPLHLAAKQNQCKTLETVVRAKRSKAINLFDNEMQTPLHIACCHGCLDCVKILVEKGADVNLCTSEGFTPLKLAINQGHVEIQQYLEQFLL